MALMNIYVDNETMILLVRRSEETGHTLVQVAQIFVREGAHQAYPPKLVKTNDPSTTTTK